MLRLLHSDQASASLCDGVSRRDFLKIGGLALGGCSLRDLLAAEAQAGIKNSHKAVIMIYLVGGPPHQDMWDLKPTAPTEIAGPMRPTATNVPGIEICDLFPQLAQRADRFACILNSRVDPSAPSGSAGRRKARVDPTPAPASSKRSVTGANISGSVFRVNRGTKWAGR